MKNGVVRKIILEDGTEYVGTGFGSSEDKKLELVFNTSMVGYQEIISDPSYTDQAVVMTYPLIGNYGINDDDFETKNPSIGALIVREYTEIPSNFRCSQSLGDYMKKTGIVGIEGVDTREITRKIRNYGSCKVLLTGENTSAEEGVEILKNWSFATDQVRRVTSKEIWVSEPATNICEAGAAAGANAVTANTVKAGAAAGANAVAANTVKAVAADANATNTSMTAGAKDTCHVVAIDCGMKLNIVRSLNKLGCKVTVVPFDTDASVITDMNPDGIFLSNGPGDPENVVETIETIKKLKGKYPIFGICLGHQMLSLAYGAKTYKLKFGHRGGNHPVKNLLTDKIEITSQNHSFAVDDESLKNTKLVKTHINMLDNTIEGVCCPEDKAFSIQYHPESAPGPQDSEYLFHEFVNLMKGGSINA